MLDILVYKGNNFAFECIRQTLCWTDAVWESWCSSENKVRGQLSISVILRNPEDMEIPRPRTIYERMLTEKMFTDATIVAGNGVNIKCHKVFPVAQSPVLAAIFRTMRRQMATSTVKIPMTETALRAFLAFRYYEEVTVAKNNCEIAFQLFEAGHKYCIGKLEEAMKDIFLEKPTFWFNVQDAFKLFLFARNLENCGELKVKAAQVLKM